MTESAIPSQLRRKRTCPARLSADYAPPYPAHSARFGSGLRAVVMAYLGVQYSRSEPVAAIARIRDALSSGVELPVFWEPTRCVDSNGAFNWIAIAYWASPESFARWRAQSDWHAWWGSADRLDGDIGYFMEVLEPAVESFETLATSSTRHEGVLRLCSHISGEVQEHAYWGSARDRIPAAQVDHLEPSGTVDFEASGVGGKRIRVLSSGNVCVIRSGQDWSDARGRERELYLQKMEPVLRRGMDFLRDSDPQVTGCYSCRYADVLDSQGRTTDKRFGLAWFRSLHDLERWSESHPTHVAIFDTFMEMVQELQGRLATQFFHEVSVVTAKQQHLEYLNCHPDTGLLRLMGART